MGLQVITGRPAALRSAFSERVAELNADRQCVRDSEALSRCEDSRQCAPLDELHDQVRGPVFELAEIPYGRDLGVVWHQIRHEFC